MNTFDPHGDDDLKLPAAGPVGSAGPAAAAGGGDDAGLASNVIRDKLKRIYAEEPDATSELAEAAARSSGRSKHQEFMYKLGASGKDLATVQTEWHKYYESLPDKEKHAVWQEFYASQSALTRGKSDSAQALAKHKSQAAKKTAGRPGDQRSSQDIRRTIRETVTAGGKLQAKHHLQSLLFGLGLGLVVILIFMFGFFNEVFIAPFIQPSRASAATPIIISTNGPAPTSTPEVIIPKINVQIPVNYNETSTNEDAIENDLQGGVVHYPTTVLPGEVGNAAYFGHSSNNIFNSGKYKFAFVLLHTLKPGDTFYLTYKDKVYVYKVISRSIVDPGDVRVLGPVAGHTATATLITCDPPGTSLHRLIVVGQQISPDPSGNTKPAVPTSTNIPVALPGNGPTLWGRFISTTTGKAITLLVLVGGGFAVLRRLNDRLVIK